MVLALLTSGCVQQGRYDDTLKTNKNLQELLVRAEDERDAANANLNTLRGQLAQATRDVLDLQAKNAELNADLDELAAAYDNLMRLVSELQIGPLPGDLESALAQLAADYPNLLTFDPKTGILRFASDFTFDLGSVELRPEAQSLLQTLAGILNSPKAQGFEVRVIGHTDTVRIGKPDTRQRHPTNVHLSCHRAIAVRDALVGAGIAPVRMMVAGYGEFRPIVPNGPQGAAANRRVEIFLLPMPASLVPSGDSVPAASAPTPPADSGDPMK
jgi:chemotaxis protein MotB